MNKHLANDIINQLQSVSHQTEWERVNYTNSYIGNMQVVIIGEDVHPVTPIKSYDTVVAFVHWDSGYLVEVGKYSRTTSKQITQIHNNHFRFRERVYFDKIR